MATILIVDDRPTNREFLVSLLGYGGHRLVEAGDGVEALAAARAERPDLVIADILMPTMDGYEFVRRLRADPAVTHIPVVFCTAHYHEQEARALARACGVAAVLTKPCEPEVVLRTVEATLGLAPPAQAPPSSAEFDREHLRLLTDKLSDKADELRRTNERLTALVELGLQLGSERNPERLLRGVCKAAREIVGARYAVVGVLTGDGQGLRHFYISGMDDETVARVVPPGPPAGPVGVVLGERRCARRSNPGGDPAAIGLPASYPPVHSWLGAPLVSLAKGYGWLELLGKIGAETFSAEDEQLAGALAAQVGRIYENGSLYAESVRAAENLRQEVAERMRAEVELRTSEEMFRSAFDYTNVAMVITDGANHFLRVNGAFAQMFGYAEEEMLGMSMADVTHPHDLAASYAQRELLLAGDRNFFQMEKRYLHKSGRVIWALTNVSLTRDGHGRPQLYIGQVQDVTERKRAEEALRASEARFRAVIEQATDAIFLHDPADGTVLDVNRRACESLGYTREELVGGPSSRFDPFVAPEQLEWMTGQLRAGRPVAIESRYRRKDGTTFPVEVRLGPIALDGRQSNLAIVRDITDRKQAEEAVRQAQQRLQHVLASSPAVLFTLAVLDGQTREITWISANVQEMLGYFPAEALAPGWWLRNIHPEDRDQVVAQTQERLFAHGGTGHEYRFRHRDGKYRWTRGDVRLVRAAAGRPVEAVGAWSDVTERRHLEDQFRQAQKLDAIGKLAGGVAHDFNNLLTVITGYAEILLDEIRPPDPHRELLAEIGKAGERAAGLTRQLLAFSRKSMLDPVVVDLNALLAELEKMLARLIGEDIDMRVTADPDLWWTKVDPGQLEQVIMNLVVNARDAMPRGGKLTIETANVELDETYMATHAEAQPGPYVLVAVSDTGHGMDEATRARVFEPFFTTKGSDKGTGLGLAVVHGIVKQSGGLVDVYSEPGVGTSFKVYLPRADEPAGSKPAVAVAPRRGTETVLLVEDEDGVRSLAKLVLERHGYQVLEARNGGEALILSRQFGEPIHLMVTDVVMPRMSGWQLAQEMAAERAGVKVLYMSGYTDDAVVRHGILTADTPFIQKPFTPDALARKVREVLG
ncbi:MAG: Blue-light-activated protein [Gemmataceae bacterium]|nr:Blue-light-activated protein [Gemmataceae bacterium]